MNNHPNAVAAGSSGLGATLLILILSAVGVTLSPVLAAAIATAIPVIVLFIGKRGIRGLIRMVWRGDEPKTPTPIV